MSRSKKEKEKFKKNLNIELDELWVQGLENYVEVANHKIKTLKKENKSLINELKKAQDISYDSVEIQDAMSNTMWPTAIKQQLDDAEKLLETTPTNKEYSEIMKASINHNEELKQVISELKAKLNKTEEENAVTNDKAIAYDIVLNTLGIDGCVLDYVFKLKNELRETKELLS